MRKERHEPAVQSEDDLIITQNAVGTTVTRLVEGDYTGYELILIANPANAGDVTIGREDTQKFPLLETQYLYFVGDLDKIYAVGTDASDKVNIILQKIKLPII